MVCVKICLAWFVAILVMIVMVLTLPPFVSTVIAAAIGVVLGLYAVSLCEDMET